MNKPGRVPVAIGSIVRADDAEKQNYFELVRYRLLIRFNSISILRISNKELYKSNNNQIKMVLPCCVCIHTQEVAVVEDLGNFKRLLDPGLHLIPFPLSQVAGTLSLRIQQLDVACETKTKDNVFVKVEVAVQFRVIVVSFRKYAEDQGSQSQR